MDNRPLTWEWAKDSQAGKSVLLALEGGRIKIAYDVESPADGKPFPELIDILELEGKQLNNKLAFEVLRNYIEGGNAWAVK